jgi:hypothetical protein
MSNTTLFNPVFVNHEQLIIFRCVNVNFISQGTPSTSSTWIWPLYCIIIGIFFIFIKLIIHRLHVMFDGEEIPMKKTEVEQSEEPTGDVDPSTEQNFPSTSHEGAETIQLQVLSMTSSTDPERNAATEHDEMPDSALESIVKALKVLNYY